MIFLRIRSKNRGNLRTFIQQESSGEILNSRSSMEYYTSSGVMAANFRSMSLRRIKRSERKATDVVTEEKFTVLFDAEFNVGTNDLVFYVRTLSQPIVVIVHGNQERSSSQLLELLSFCLENHLKKQN